MRDAVPISALRRSQELCAMCPKMCSFACPVSETTGREALTPWAKVSLAHLSGTAPDASAAAAFSGCTGCLRCLQHCAHENDVPSALYAARAAAVSANTAPSPYAEVALRFSRAGHAEAEDVAAVHAALARSELQPARPAPFLIAGCKALAAGGAVARDALQASRALAVPLALGPSEALCCGLVLLEAGHPELYAAHVGKLRATLLRAAGGFPLHLVFLDAGCARAAVERWPAVGAALPEGTKVEHATTWLARALASVPDGARPPPLPGAVAYHDPCELSRGLLETTAPRALLSAALAGGVREPPRGGAETSCCGAGGLLPRTMPDVAMAMAEERRHELEQCGAPVATASPGCAQALGAEDAIAIVARWLAGGPPR